MNGTFGETSHDFGTSVVVADRSVMSHLPVRAAYPTDEVAIRLGVSERTVFRLIDDKAGEPELPSITVGRARRVLHTDLDAYIERKRQEADQRARQRAANWAAKHPTAGDTDEGGAGSGPAGGAGTGPRPPYPPSPGK